MKELVDYHARVDEAKPKDGFTALKAAASKGHSDIVSELTHLPCPPFTFLTPFLRIGLKRAEKKLGLW